MLQPNDASSNGRRGAVPRKAARRTIARSETARRRTAASATAGNGHLRRYYEHLLAEFGPQGWWPAETRLEVILGAILTQNTTWRNASLAIAQLRTGGMLDLAQLRAISAPRLESLIRPAGFYRQKARSILAFLQWLNDGHGSSLDAMFSRPSERLRDELLQVKGLGPETVDAILLYAGQKPFFVADAYTRRILSRHGLLPDDANYAEAQEAIHELLEREPAIYNEFHALLVEVGKRFCRRKDAQCGGCPLEQFLPAGGPHFSPDLA